MKKRVFCIAAVCLLLMLPLGVRGEDTAKEAAYQRAVEFMEEDNYDLAISVFEMLGDYSDSVAQLAVCKDAKSGSIYDRAVELMAEGSYDTAKEIFLSLGDYKDSTVKAVECETGKKQDQYEMALQLAEKGQYEKAKSVFLLLGSYADSANQVKLMEDSLRKEDYEAAVALQEACDWEKAIVALEALEDYSDCAERIEVCRNELEKEDLEAEIKAALKAEEFSAETFYLLLQKGEEMNLDPEQLGYWLRDGWNLETKALCGDTASYQEADLDGDGVVERTAAGNGQLFLLQETETGLEQISSQEAAGITSLELKEDEGGRHYLLTSGGGQMGVWLFEADWKCITLEETDGKDLDFEATGSGFLLTRLLTEDPQRKQTTEYIVLSGEQFSPLEYPVEVDLATYPKVDAVEVLLKLYRDAKAFRSTDELARLVSDRADEASLEELDAWLTAHERLEWANLALWDQNTQGFLTRLSAGADELWTMVLPTEGGELMLGGSPETIAPSEVEAAAPTFEETEEGITWDVPQALCANVWISGEMTFDEYNYEYDEDYYRLILPAAGEIRLQVNHDYLDSSYAVFEIRLREAGTDLVLWSQEIVGSIPQQVLPAFFLGAGIYDLTIAQREEVTISYDICAAFTEDPFVELERNDAPELATAMQVNQPMRGALGWDGDVDYYTLTLEEAGAAVLRLSHEYFEDSSPYYVLNLYQTIGGDTIRRIEIRGQDSSLETYPIFLDAGTYYFRMEEYHYTAIPYTLEVAWEADANVEREENDSFAHATQIPVNTPIRGAFTTDDDVDFYIFTLEQAGEVVLKHSHEYFDNGYTHYNYAFYQEARSEALLFDNACSGQDSVFIRDAVYLTAGTYYVKVSSNHWTTRPYTMEIAFAPMEAIEQERNETYSEATPIAVNQEYAGSLMTDEDRDFYTFTLNELSEVRVGLGFSYFDSDYTYFKLFLDTDARNDSTYFTTELTGWDNDYQSNPFYLPAGTYYLHLESSYHTSKPYRLQISAMACTDAEEEWNNDYESANPIGIYQEMKGAIRYDDDQDCYMFTLQQAGMARIHFRHDWFDDSDTYYQVFLDAQPNNSDRRIEMYISGQDWDVYSDRTVLQPGTYYLTVVGSYYDYPPSTPYVISVE